MWHLRRVIWACFVIMNLAKMFIIVEFQPLHLHFFIKQKHEKETKSTGSCMGTFKATIRLCYCLFLSRTPSVQIVRNMSSLGSFFLEVECFTNKTTTENPKQVWGILLISTQYIDIYIYIYIDTI